MAVELRLKKPDKSPWGFRLAGGADFDVPLTVIKVAPGSIAENAGMQIGDVVVRINDVAISPLTHVQAHDVIVSGGNEFVMAVRRGDLSNLPPRLLLYDSDVENEATPKGEADLNITDEEIATIIGSQVQSTQNHVQDVSICHQKEESVHEETVEVSVQKSHVAQVIIEEQSQQQLDVAAEKKWSTFLQKPKNAKPKPKPQQEDAPKAAPYRVVIKKQPKKSEASPQGSTSNNKPDDVNNNEEIQDTEKNDEDNKEDVEIKAESIDENEPEQIINEESEEVIQKEDNEEVQIEDDEDLERNERMLQEQSQKKLSVNLEEQLAEVQKQLQALSQLPSAIQQTLNAVTRQLSELVSASQEISIETNVRIEEEESIEEQTESVEYREQALSVLEEASCEEEETGQVTFEAAVARTESDDEQELFEALERECEMESQIMTEEEMVAHQLEQERLEKKEKERRGSSSHPLTPLQRPIILPGGRKWSDPNDVTPKYRKPSLTDERIAKTINSYTEVVSGRTMGINFLKYQPPPKNLDYLQKSAVYRLIHEMDPPPQGIVSRDITVLAEQDYYGQVEVSESSADLV
nr:trichohyalin-like [Onthophagus taurus]